MLDVCGSLNRSRLKATRQCLIRRHPTRGPRCLTRSLRAAFIFEAARGLSPSTTPPQASPHGQPSRRCSTIDKTTGATPGVRRPAKRSDPESRSRPVSSIYRYTTVKNHPRQDTVTQGCDTGVAVRSFCTALKRKASTPFPVRPRRLSASATPGRASLDWATRVRSQTPTGPRGWRLFASAVVQARSRGPHHGRTCMSLPRRVEGNRPRRR